MDLLEEPFKTPLTNVVWTVYLKYRLGGLDNRHFLMVLELKDQGAGRLVSGEDSLLAAEGPLLAAFAWILRAEQVVVRSQEKTLILFSQGFLYDLI